MGSVRLEDLEAFAARAAGPRHDAFSRDSLARAFEEYQQLKGVPLAPVRLTLGGRPFAHLFEALADPEVTLWEGSLTLEHPPPAGPAWEWSRPVREITFHADGSADLVPLDGGAPERAIGRILRRDYYVPGPATGTVSRRRLADDPRPGLLPLSPAVQLLRKSGFVPFGVAVLLYTSQERVRYDLDLVDSTLLKDPRAGKLPLARRVRRTSRVAHDVDSFLARGELAVRTARVLEVLVESHGLTPIEVSEVFGGVREFGSSALRTLQSRGLASLDRQTGLYRPRFEVFRPSAASGAVDTSHPLPNPALRTSVMELLAAADSRATCPLCGDPLPPGHRGILCARCEAEVGSADASSVTR